MRAGHHCCIGSTNLLCIASQCADNALGFPQAQEAITLAMKAPTPSPDKAEPAAGDSTAEAAPDAKRQGQRERTQVVLYSPGKAARQPQLASKTAAKLASQAEEEVRPCG